MAIPELIFRVIERTWATFKNQEWWNFKAFMWIIKNIRLIKRKRAEAEKLGEFI